MSKYNIFHLIKTFNHFEIPYPSQGEKNKNPVHHLLMYSVFPSSRESYIHPLAGEVWWGIENYSFFLSYLIPASPLTKFELENTDEKNLHFSYKCCNQHIAYNKTS